jgi:outer membrane lipoprotein-sorting protein
LFLLIVIGTASAQTLYDFTSAYVEKSAKTVTSSVEITTTEQFYIVESGNKTARYITEIRNISMANIVEESRSVSIVDGNWVTTYNPDTKEGNKMKLDIIGNLSGLSDDEQQQMADQIGQSMNTETEDIGTKEIAGVTCTGTRSTTNLMGMNTITEIWMYKKFTMETNSNSSGTTVNGNVTKFEEGANVDPEKLKVPADVNITEVTSPY